MKYWEIDSEQHGYVRIEWNEGATFNLQAPIGGEWVDFHCFTCYGITEDHEALETALETLEELDQCE